MGSHPQWCATETLVHITDYSWKLSRLPGQMNVEHHYRKGQALLSGLWRRLHPCRNQSVMNSCNMCSQWRHLLHAVLLFSYPVYNVMTVKKEETVSVNLPRLTQNIFYMFFFDNPIYPQLAPLLQSVSYIIGLLPPYRAKWENTTILHSTQWQSNFHLPASVDS